MAKFRFRLATLLKLREATRDERRAELAQAYQADALLEQQQDRLQRELAGLVLQSRKVAGPGTLDVDQLLQTQRYELFLRARQSQLADQRGTVAEEIERRRQILVEADREVRVLEKLRQRQLERHREEEGRREMKILDEVAGLRALRGGG